MKPVPVPSDCRPKEHRMSNQIIGSREADHSADPGNDPQVNSVGNPKNNYNADCGKDYGADPPGNLGNNPPGNSTNNPKHDRSADPPGSPIDKYGADPKENKII